MKVTRIEISKQFDALIDGSSSREDTEKWVEARMRAQELGELVYEPAAAADRLWTAIKYLFGVAVKTSPSDYLHSVEDFEAFRRELEV